VSGSSGRGREKTKMSRADRSLMYKPFIGNKAEGQGFADKRKRKALYAYRKMESKDKVELDQWSEKVKKIYNEVDSSEDETVSTSVPPTKVKEANSAKVRPVKLSAFHREEHEWAVKNAEKEAKRKAAEEREREREIALSRRQKEKVRKNKLLLKKNYKGQPNMAARMMLLLEKIEKNSKT